MAEAFAVGLMADTGNAYGHGVAEGVINYVNQVNDGRLVLQLPFVNDLSPLRKWPFKGLVVQAQRWSQVEAVRALGLPVVNVSVTLGPREIALPTVCTDNRGIGSLAAKYFLERGFEHFGYVEDGDRYYSLVRGEGFLRSLAEAGFECASFRWEPMDADPTRSSSPPPGRPLGRGRKLTAWLLRLPKPAAVFVANDQRAADVLRACEQVGLDVPELIAVLGVDDEPYIHQVLPISSIPQPAERVGYEAARVLDRLIAGQTPPACPILVPHEGRVVTRRSSDATPMRDADVAKAMRFIREHAARPIGVEDVSEYVALTRRTLERRFRAATGGSPLAEIHRVHLERAKELLAKSDKPVAEVALASGFGNANRFSMLFRAHLSMTPSEYRRQFRPA